MKKILLKIFCVASLSLGAQTTHNLSMGADYAHQVYYSLENGEVKSVKLNSWDLAFRLSTRGSDIRVNTTQDITLKVYENGDKNNWDNIDTTGFASWRDLHDSDTSWSVTALNKSATSTLDVGWGMYNTITHLTNGDSVYIIRLSNDDYKKFWIKSLAGGVYTLIHADIDHSNLDTVYIDKGDYTNKNFAYFKFGEDEDKDLEPANDSWDLLFTKYVSEVASDYYMGVSGVLTNMGVIVEEVRNVSPLAASFSGDFSEQINTIGYDWKSLNYQNFQFEIEPDLSYFVKNINGDVYQVWFESFGGSANGNVSFKQQLISPSSVHVTNSNQLSVYPNPVTSQGDLNFDGIAAGSQLQVFSSNGHLVFSEILMSNTIALPALSSGFYQVNVISNGQSFQNKLIVK